MNKSQESAVEKWGGNEVKKWRKRRGNLPEQEGKGAKNQSWGTQRARGTVKSRQKPREKDTTEPG